MQINSSKFNNTQQIPIIYTCKGQNINPPLNFSDIPEKTVTLALIMHDPDSPNGNFIHWLFWNLPPDTQIAEASKPQATEGINDFGKIGYGGPCPHTGSHRYIFTLFALDQKIQLKKGATEAELKAAISGHIIDQSTLTGIFSA